MAIDPNAIERQLDQLGYATAPALLSAGQCQALVALYAEPARFRSRIVMQRHSFGQGEYQYFAYPLPEPIEELRRTLYAVLAPIANRWREALGQSGVFPDDLATYLAQCHDAGQRRPTPLLLKYGPGDSNRLHQDLYGPLNFPMQMTVLLSRPAEDFSGGEFVLTEQRPRAQSRVEVVPLSQGDAVIFAVHQRPAQGTRGAYRVTMRHGVSRVRDGERYTLGVIFHDAA
jgi:hypothetical protein